MYPTINLQKIRGSEIGRGAEKIVYRHADDPNLCIKLCAKNNARSIRREIKYFNFLEKKQIKASFVPKFYGAFQAENTIGFLQECFLDKSNGGEFDSVSQLYSYITSGSCDLDEVLEMLEALKKEMVQKNIIVCDLHSYNFLRVEKNGHARLIIIDGYGSPEILPLPQYLSFFGKFKIERQWKKFYRRLEPVIKNQL